MLKKVMEKYRKMPPAAKATMWFIICSIIQKSISIITTPIFTRLLSTEQYGTYSIYLSWLQVFSIFTTFRLDYSVFNKGMSKFKNSQDEYTTSMQSLTTILTTIMLIVYIVFRRNINQLTELNTFITLAIFAELYITPAINFWSLRKRYDFEYRSVVSVTILLAVLNAFVGIIAVYFSKYKDTARILSCVGVNVCIGLIIYIYNLYKSKKWLVWKYVRFAVLFNLPLIPHYFSTYILQQSDRIMILKMCGINEAGLYSIAYNVGALMKIITASITNAFIPWIYRKLDEKGYKDLEKVFYPIIIFIALISSIFIAFAPELMKVLADESYQQAVAVIPPVAASIFFIFMFGMFGNVEFYYDANKFTMYISFIGAMLNLILNYIFISAFGYVAAGYTTLACNMVFSLSHYCFMQYVIKKKAGIKLLNGKVMATICTIVLLFTLLMSSIYAYTLLRYLIILIICLMIYFKRKYFIKIAIQLKNN